MAYISTPVPLPVSQGGTGNVYGIPDALQIGNGYGAFNGLVPGPNGYVVTSDGTQWYSAPGGGGASSIIAESSQVISSNYTLSAGKNGMSLGSVTINTGVTVTIPTGQRWRIFA